MLGAGKTLFVPTIGGYRVGVRVRRGAYTLRTDLRESSNDRSRSSVHSSVHQESYP